MDVSTWGSSSPTGSPTGASTSNASARSGRRPWSDPAASWRQVTRVRTEEPTGYLGLARKLLRLERLDEAREVLDHLRRTSWPSHFGDVHHRAEQLLKETYAGG